MIAVGLESQYAPRAEGRPLLWALLISVGIHAFLFWLLFILALGHLLLVFARRDALAEMKRVQEARTNSLAAQEPQLMFVMTDPSEATKDAPKNAKYYSSQSSKAANPDAQVETDTPKIDGSQTHVPQTETAQKATPLQPALPKEPTPPEPEKETQPNNSPKPGDLAMLKPAPSPEENKENTDAPKVGQRPHTLEEARQMLGLKMKEDGGVQRRRIKSSFDVVGTPFGEYDARIIAAIQQRWYDLCDSHADSVGRSGKVVVEFRLDYDGRIENMRVVSSDVGDLQSYLCQSAIQDPSPYERWPAQLRRQNMTDYREVTFTFYYE